MKRFFAPVAAILLSAFALSMSTSDANAVVYCQYVNYPTGCIVRPGVVLRPRAGCARRSPPRASALQASVCAPERQ